MATVATTIDSLTAAYLDQLAVRTPRSHELRREAEPVLAGGVSSHFKAWQPFYVREAKGAHLTDVDGNDYVDLIMGFGPNSLGHSPAVVLTSSRDSSDYRPLIERSGARGFIPKAELSGDKIAALAV